MVRLAVLESTDAGCSRVSPVAIALAYLSRVMSLAYTAQYQHINHRVGLSNRGDYRLKLAELLSHGLPTRETAILLLGDVGRHSSDTELCSILELLLQQLGSSSAPLRSLAYTEVGDLTRHTSDHTVARPVQVLWEDAVYSAISFSRADQCLPGQ